MVLELQWEFFTEKNLQLSLDTRMMSAGGEAEILVGFKMVEESNLCFTSVYTDNTGGALVGV